MSEIKVKLGEREVILDNPSIDEGDNRKREKLKIWVKEQTYYGVSENWKYDDTLTEKVDVDYKYGVSSKQAEWEVAIEKGYFTNNLVLTRDNQGRNVVLGKPTIGTVSYRWGAIIGWVVGIGLSLAAIAVIGKKAKKENKLAELKTETTKPKLKKNNSSYINYGGNYPSYS